MTVVVPSLLYRVSPLMSERSMKPPKLAICLSSVAMAVSKSVVSSVASAE